MGIRITGNEMLESNINRAQKDASDSLERLSSGVRFTRNSPLPADKIQSDKLSSKMRDINNYKRNSSDGLSLTEFADSNLSELSNINIRLKELVTQSTNSSISDKERQFLFIEYQSLYDEMNRIAHTTTYNGEPLLNYKEGNKTKISFRVGQPTFKNSEDINVIKLKDLSEVQTRPEDLGLISAKDLLENESGVSIDDVLDNFDAESENDLGSTFNQAGEKIAGYRAQFGAITTRLNQAIQSIDIAYENISAANSRLRDVDYATEISNLTKASILIQAGTSLLTQSQELKSQSILTLIRGMER